MRLDRPSAFRATCNSPDDVKQGARGRDTESSIMLGRLNFFSGEAQQLEKLVQSQCFDAVSPSLNEFGPWSAQLLWDKANANQDERSAILDQYVVKRLWQVIVIVTIRP